MRAGFFAAALAYTLAGGAAASADGVPLIGVLAPGGRSLPGGGDDFVADLEQGLRELALIDGRNVHVLVRSADGDYSRLPALAAALVIAKPDVIVTASTPAVLAVEGATHTIPLVFASMADPIAQGVARSLAHPGGNATGITLLSSELNAKRLSLVKEALPKATRVAVIENPENPALSLEMRDFDAVARDLGIEIKGFDTPGAEAFGAAVAGAAAWKADALLMLDDRILATSAAQLERAASNHALPTICPGLDNAEAGCLFAYGVDIDDNYRRAAVFVAKILKGEKPGDIPIENPTQFTMIANLKVAKALGIALPTATLLRADRVIE